MDLATNLLELAGILLGVAVIIALPVIAGMRGIRRSGWWNARVGVPVPQEWRRADPAQRRRIWRALKQGQGVSCPEDVAVALAYIDFYDSPASRRQRLLLGLMVGGLVALAAVSRHVFVGELFGAVASVVGALRWLFYRARLKRARRANEQLALAFGLEQRPRVVVESRPAAPADVPTPVGNGIRGLRLLALLALLALVIGLEVHEGGSAFDSKSPQTATVTVTSTASVLDTTFYDVEPAAYDVDYRMAQMYGLLLACATHTPWRGGVCGTTVASLWSGMPAAMANEVQIYRDLVGLSRSACRASMRRVLQDTERKAASMRRFHALLLGPTPRKATSVQLVPTGSMLHVLQIRTNCGYDVTAILGFLTDLEMATRDVTEQ